MIEITKDYKWEMGHRLTHHDGICTNIHGHSYGMTIHLTGKLNQDQMVLDYYDMDQIVMPVVKSLDHSFLCSKDDSQTINFLESIKVKKMIFENFTTAENIAIYILEQIAPSFAKFENIYELKVNVRETSDVGASARKILNNQIS